jgi:hypothetical protein
VLLAVTVVAVMVESVKAVMTNYLIPALHKQEIAGEDFYDGN